LPCCLKLIQGKIEVRDIDSEGIACCLIK
jgi:hypothetical protein